MPSRRRRPWLLDTTPSEAEEQHVPRSATRPWLGVLVLIASALVIWGIAWWLLAA